MIMNIDERFGIIYFVGALYQLYLGEKTG